MCSVCRSVNICVLGHVVYDRRCPWKISALCRYVLFRSCGCAKMTADSDVCYQTSLSSSGMTRCMPSIATSIMLSSGSKTVSR